MPTFGGGGFSGSGSFCTLTSGNSIVLASVGENSVGNEGGGALTMWSSSENV